MSRARAPAEGRPPTLKRRVEISLLRDRAHYDELVMGAIAGAKVSLWISTANVKELRVEAPIGSRARARGRYVSILELFDGLAARGVEIRLLHAGVPSRAFSHELRRRRRPPLEMRRCPRVHLKMIAVDGALLYLGSANFTGAGLGAKGAGRRNFEAGVLTDDDVLLDEMQGAFDAIWAGRECAGCALRALCPGPLDQLTAGAPPGPAVAPPGPAVAPPRPAVAPPRPAGAPPRPAGAGEGARGSAAAAPAARRAVKSRLR